MGHPQQASTGRRTWLAVALGIAVTLATVGPGPAAAASAVGPAVVVEAARPAADPLPDPSEHAPLVSDAVGPEVPAWSYALVAVLAALLLAAAGRSRPPRRVARRGRREG